MNYLIKINFIFGFLLLANLNCPAQDFKSEIRQFRKDYVKDLLEDERSPLKAADTSFLSFYEPDSNYRVKARVDIILNADTLFIPYLGKASGRDYLPYATLKFTLNGKLLELTAFQSLARPNSDRLFILFLDETNGSDTYGGGRYLDLYKKDIQNRTIIIDFNKSYNPYCAFSANFSCPKPPDSNNLAISISAGEKNFGKEVTH